MAVAYLTAPSPVGIAEANAVFDALDDALSVLFNAQSPLLYLSHAEWKEAGLAGLLCIFGTMASRRIFSATASHDQSAIDTAAAAATILSQDDDLKQVELDMVADALSTSLVIQKRTVTPPTGPDEPYFAKVEFIAGHYHHEKRHDLAAVDVVFEGHASRAFTWESAWDKCRCLRFHNLDSDSTPLVVTMGSTGQTFTLNRWDCITVRLSDDGTSWEQEGFVLWRMRAADLERIGNSMPWNDRRGAMAGETAGSVWYADGANNVASWALVVHLLDHFAIVGTPGVMSEVGAGVAGANEPKTGFAFDLSDITHDAGRLRPFLDPADSATPIYRLALHGGKLVAISKPTGDDETFATSAPSIDGLLGGDTASNLIFEIDPGGATAYLRIIDETGLDRIDVVPVGMNFGATGHPFEVPADGVGYSVPPMLSGWDGIDRLRAVTESETVPGIGTTVTTDYDRLEEENSNSTYADPLAWTAFGGTVGDVRGWAFHDGTKNNSHGTFMTNSVRWDGRVLGVDTQLRIVPSGGACPKDVAAGRMATLFTASLTFGHLDWFQHAPVQSWPPAGGIWHTPKYARRSMVPDATAIPIRHPNAKQWLGTTDGADYTMRDSRLFTRSQGIKRQLPINDVTGTGLDASPVELTGCYFEAGDSTTHILANYSTPGWWALNRANAIAGTALAGEVRPVIAPVLCARHFNAIARRLNALLSVVPFSFFDAQWYGRPFRPDYSSGGIFGGHVYPYGFLCYENGDAATRAADLGVTVRDTVTELGAYGGFTEIDVDLYDSGGYVGRAFDVAAGTPFNAWNMDLPAQFRVGAGVNRNESVEICDVDPETVSGEPGWTQGELAFQTASDLTPGATKDWYAWFRANDAAFDFPEFTYLRADDVAATAADLGIPFRLFRLCSQWDLYKFDPDRQGMGVRQLSSTYRTHVYPGTGAFWSKLWTRTEVRLVPAFELGLLVMFAGTGEQWAPQGLFRVSDWTAFPGTAGSDDATVKWANADPMHSFDRSGSGNLVEFPYGFAPITGTPAPTWQNSGPFSGESPHGTLEIYDTTPTPPAGWSATVPRVGTYPVPATQWGVSDIESNPAPDVAACWIRAADLPNLFTAEDLWSGANGAGAWDGKGGFAVHLFPPTISAP